MKQSNISENIIINIFFLLISYGVSKYCLLLWCYNMDVSRESKCLILICYAALLSREFCILWDVLWRLIMVAYYFFIYKYIFSLSVLLPPSCSLLFLVFIFFLYFNVNSVQSFIKLFSIFLSI